MNSAMLTTALAWANQPWGRALLFTLAALVASAGLMHFVRRGIKSWTDYTDTSFDNILFSKFPDVHGLALLVWSAWAGTAMSVPDAPAASAARLAGKLAIYLYGALWVTAVIAAVTEGRITARKAESDGAAWRTIGTSAKVLAWGLAVLCGLDAAGVNVTALVAGLGVGGIAMGFALQKVAADTFASFSILIDQPFRAGDFVGVGDVVGTVESIGWRTTSFRVASGEIVVLANTDVVAARIRNFREMQGRRQVFRFSVGSRSPQVLTALLASAADVVAKLSDETASKGGLAVSLERVHLVAVGEKASDFEISYVVDSPHQNDLMDVHQAILLGLLEKAVIGGAANSAPSEPASLLTGATAIQAGAPGMHAQPAVTSTPAVQNTQPQVASAK